MNTFILTNCKIVNMKGPELQIEFCAYYNDKKEKFDEGGLYPFLEYCQLSKPKDVVVRVDYEMGFDEIDIYCESLAISNLSYEKIDDGNFVAKFTCDSKSGKPLMRVIYALGKTGNGGHSYTFTVGKEKFYFDGDGADRIMKINDVKFQKIKSSYDLGKVWNDTTRKNNGEIDNNMSVNIEEIVRQSIKNIVNESHGKKKHNAPKDTLAAMRKGNREADQEIFGGGFRQTKKVHKAKNDYSRKNNKVNVNTIDKFRENESVDRISMNDMCYMVTECVKRILKEMYNINDNPYPENESKNMIYQLAYGEIDYLYNEGVVDYDDENLCAMANGEKPIDYCDLIQCMLYDCSTELENESGQMLRNYCKLSKHYGETIPDVEEAIDLAVKNFVNNSNCC